MSSARPAPAIREVLPDPCGHGAERHRRRAVVHRARAPRFGLHAPYPRARLRVRDSGIGIPAAARQRIFEPFTDVKAAKHHTSSVPDSAGLGLFIARGLVELHGGRITVDSEEGHGSEFTVLMPRQR